jgi:hypothetical protein
MAEQYFDAANVLIESIERGRVEDYRLGTPVLYLYRHWLELAVKSIIGPIHGHNLVTLSGLMVSSLSKRDVQVPHWVTARILEMAKIDPSSTAFRYAGNSVAGEIYVSLPHLKDALRLLHVALASVAHKGVFPPESLFTLIGEDVASGSAYRRILDWIG